MLAALPYYLETIFKTPMPSHLGKIPMNIIPDPASLYINLLNQSMDQQSVLIHPLMASVSITGRCNSKCSYCGIWMDKTTDLPVEDWHMAIEELGSIGVQLISLTGGEPLLYRETELLIRRIRERGMIASLTTNGMLINPARLQSLREAGLNSLGISLDTIDPGTYAAIRGAPIEPVLRALKYVSESSDFRAAVNCVVSRKNISLIVPLVEYCSERGIFVSFQPLHISPRDHLVESGLIFTEQDLTELHALVEKLLSLQQSGYKIEADTNYLQGFPEFLVYQRIPPDFICTAGFTTIAIDQDLNVKSCWSMRPIGNLHKSKLIDLWQSKTYDDRRKTMMKLQCPKCWYRCHTEYCSEEWIRKFLGWIASQKSI